MGQIVVNWGDSMEIRTYTIGCFRTVMSYVTACELLDFEYSVSKNVLPDNEIEYRLVVYYDLVNEGETA